MEAENGDLEEEVSFLEPDHSRFHVRFQSDMEQMGGWHPNT